MPIPVPDQLRRPSDVVQRLRSRKDFHIRQAEKNRALRLVEALVLEARRRGYEAEPTPDQPMDRSRFTIYPKDHGHLAITIGGDNYRLTLRQEEDRIPHIKTKAEEAHGWAPKYDSVISSRLRITIEGDEYPFWQSAWSDKPSRPLEDDLAQILQEVESRHERAVARREEEIRRAEERQRQWEQARDRAIKQLNDAHRVAELKAQLEHWELAQRLERFIAAVEAHIQDHPEQAEQCAPWLA